MTPLIEKIVRSYSGKVRLVKVNVDENQADRRATRVQSLPTVLAFRDGQPIDGFVGVQPESAIKAFVDRLIADDAEVGLGELLKAAEDLLEQGDLQGAAEIFATVLQEDRTNAEALAGLASCYLKSGDTTRAKQTLALVPPDKRDIAAVRSVEAAVLLAGKGSDTGDLSALQKRLEQQRQRSSGALRSGRRSRGERRKGEALDLLLDLVRMDSKWNEEAARKQLLQFFDAWGPKEPLVAEGRRRLSSILFS